MTRRTTTAATACALACWWTTTAAAQGAPAPADTPPQAATTAAPPPAATTPSDAAPAAASEPTTREDRKLLAIAVYELEAQGVDARQARVVQATLLAELRKLDRVTVIGTDEIQAMLQHEANKQLLGCAQDSCLSEIADALGVDVLVVGALARVNDEHVFGLKRVDQTAAKVTGQVNRRFTAGNGEEFLVAVGPAVEELFPDVPLRPGAERGATKEMAIRLNPPPLPAWVFWTGAAATTGLVVGASVVGVLNVAAQDDYARYKTDADPFVLAVYEEKGRAVNDSAYAFFALAGGATALAIATGIAAFFTDFWGYAEMNEEALR